MEFLGLIFNNLKNRFPNKKTDGFLEGINFSFQYFR